MAARPPVRARAVEMTRKLTPQQRDAVVGPGAVRFTIPHAFVDESGLIVEMRAYEMGPRGGCGDELQLTAEYWDGLLKKLAERGVSS